MTIKEAHHTECHIEYNISDQQLLNGILHLEGRIMYQEEIDTL